MGEGNRASRPAADHATHEPSPSVSALRVGIVDATSLRKLIERFQREDRPLPWVVHSGCSYRRIASIPTRENGYRSFPDGNVLHAYNQRSDNHPDLSMGERELEALVEAINRLPAIAGALEAAAETLATHPGYSADVTFAAIWQWLEKRDAALASIAAASGIVAAEGGRDPQGLDERSEQSPVPEGGDAR